MLITSIRPPPSRLSCRSISCLSASHHGTLRRPKLSQPRINQSNTLLYDTITSTSPQTDAWQENRRRPGQGATIPEAERLIFPTQSLQKRWIPSRYLDEETEVGVIGKDNDYQYDQDLSEDHENSNDGPKQLESNPMLYRNVRKSILNSLNSKRTSQRRRKPHIVNAYQSSRTSIYAGDARSQSQSQQAWTPKKLATVELSIAKLTVRFALEAYKDMQKDTSFWDIAGHLDAAFRRNFTKNLATLEQKQEELKRCDALDLGSYQHVQHPRYGPDSTFDPIAIRHLHIALLTIFRRLSRHEFDVREALSRISYNLMSAQCAPSVKTYNILISRFSRLGEYAIVDMVLDSFFETHIRPNELIIPTIIAHYSRSGNQQGFERFLGQLQGERGGVMLAHPKISANGIAVSSKRVLHQDDKVIQRMTLDPQSFYTIISTHLRFNNSSKASAWLASMRKAGIEPDLPLMLSFLRYDIRHAKRDISRVTGTFHEIRTKWLSPAQLLDLDHVEFTYAATAYFTMLHFYKKRGYHSEWRKTYTDALAKGFTMQELLAHKINPAHRPLHVEYWNRLRLWRRIMERRYELLRQDLELFEAHVMAAKIILSGLPLHAVLATMARTDAEGSEARRAVNGNKPWLNCAVHISEQIPEAGLPTRREAIAQYVRANLRDCVRGNEDTGEASAPETRRARQDTSNEAGEARMETGNRRNAYRPTTMSRHGVLEEEFLEGTLQAA